jgi:alpha-mannosidase
LTPKLGNNGALPTLVGCDDRNVVVESVKKAEDSNEINVRLYECHNARGRAELTCALPIKSAALCDLEENELNKLEVMDGAVSFDYRPFEILTIRLEV